MKIKILPERCIACGLCQTYSDVFDYDDEGIVKFSQHDQLVDEVDENPATLRAVKECPTKALLIDRD